MSVESIEINQTYPKMPLRKVAIDPYEQFTEWFEEAKAVMPAELVNAMSVSTVGADGRPSSRMILLKQYDHQGFVFFTNYQSKKGQQIHANPHISLLFWWERLGRQIRIEGRAEKVSPQLSDDYFRTRSRASQIAAIVSAQSSVVHDFGNLQAQFQQLLEEYHDESVELARPANWGGYIVKPDLIEFWQEGADRFHDRFQYRLQASNRWQLERSNHWQIERLSP